MTVQISYAALGRIDWRWFQHGLISHSTWVRVPLLLLIIFKIMGEEKKVKLMYAIYAPTIRGIVEQANEIGIQREDIVSLMENEGQYVLTYYA